MGDASSTGKSRLKAKVSESKASASKSNVDRILEIEPIADRSHAFAKLKPLDGLCKNRGMSQTSLLPRGMLYSEAEAALVGSRHITCGGE